MYKSINVGSFSISMDFMKAPDVKPSLGHPRSEAVSSASGTTSTASEEVEERVRVYYDPIISNLNVHIRCMFSLWEGLVDALLSKHMGGTGAVAEEAEASKPSYWSEDGAMR